MTQTSLKILFVLKRCLSVSWQLQVRKYSLKDMVNSEEDRGGRGKVFVSKKMFLNNMIQRLFLGVLVAFRVLNEFFFFELLASFFLIKCPLSPQIKIKNNHKKYCKNYSAFSPSTSWTSCPDDKQMIINDITVSRSRM